VNKIFSHSYAVVLLADHSFFSSDLFEVWYVDRGQ